jgi:transcriptional regulator with XRE-family HTH domain
MSQSDVAKILKVSTDTVTGWELNRYGPTIRPAKSIIAFIGHFPFKVDGISLGKQLYYARLITGKTQKQVADQIGCDASNLRYIELNAKKPLTGVRAKIHGFTDVVLAMIYHGQVYKEHRSLNPQKRDHILEQKNGVYIF